MASVLACVVMCTGDTGCVHTHDFFKKVFLLECDNDRYSYNLLILICHVYAGFRANSAVHVCIRLMSLQVEAEEAAWGASRATLSSWRSKSSMDLLHSSSLPWRCWHHSVSPVRLFNSSFYSQWILSQIGTTESPTEMLIPKRLDAVSGQNSSYQQSCDLLGNSTD